MTEDYDIGFGVFHREGKKGKEVEVLPIKRVDCYMIPEEGHLICQNKGTCQYELLYPFNNIITCVNCSANVFG